MIDFTEKLISRSPVIVRRRVQWGECDPAGVVFTPRFADYVVSARDWFMRAGLGITDRPHPSVPTGLAWPMRALSFEFMSFLAADDLFDMRVTVPKIGARSFTFAVAATHLSGVSAFSAQGTSVCIDRGSRLAVPVPPEMLDVLHRYQASQAE